MLRRSRYPANRLPHQRRRRPSIASSCIAQIRPIHYRMHCTASFALHPLQSGSAFSFIFLFVCLRSFFEKYFNFLRRPLFRETIYLGAFCESHLLSPLISPLGEKLGCRVGPSLGKGLGGLLGFRVRVALYINRRVHPAMQAAMQAAQKKTIIYLSLI